MSDFDDHFDDRLTLFHNERIRTLLSQFDYAHLPERLQQISVKFYNLAHDPSLVVISDNHMEQLATIGFLESLLTTKDIAVRKALC